MPASKVQPPPPGPCRAGVMGVLATALALGVTELLAAVFTGGSLLATVGARFIDLVAARLKSVAVSLLGTWDKPVLWLVMLLTVAGLGWFSGWMAVRRFYWGASVLVLVGLIGAVSAVTSSTAVGLVAAVVIGTTVGVVALRVLTHRLMALDSSIDPDPDDPSELVAEPDTDSATSGTTRRAFTTAVAGTASAVAITGLGSVVIRSMRPTGTNPGSLRLPSVPSPITMPNQPFTVPGLSPYVVPNGDFYSIDTALLKPQVDVNSWVLRIDGMVRHPLTFTYADLLAMPAMQSAVTLACVSNPVGGDLVGNAIWQGVPLRTLLEQAGVLPQATQVVGHSVDGFTAGFPTAALTDRTALVAYGMNGQPLPVDHGFPARLVVAGLYGYVSATKWLSRLELTTLDAVDGYWISRGWAKQAPVKVQSRIDVPRDSATVTAGPVVVAGVAWAPARGIRAVQVQVDDGSWQPAQLGAVVGVDTWVQWRYTWVATVGTHVVRVRAVETDGSTQPGDRRPPEPDGATGYDERRITVR